MSEWERTTLHAVVDTRLGKTLPRGSGQDLGGDRYLRNVNVRWGRISTTDLNRMMFSKDEREKYRLRRGDVLVCEGGEVGRCALVHDDLDGIFFQNALHRLRVRDPERLIPNYLAYWLEHFVASGGLIGLTSQVTIAHLNQTKLRSLEIPLPPLDEQRRIVDVMAAVDAQIEALEAEAEAARRSIGPLIESVFGAADAWPVRTLGEVGEFLRGKRFTKADYTDDGIGVIHYSHLHTHLGHVTHRAVAFVGEEKRDKLRFAAPGDVVIAATSEDLEGVGRATAWLGEGAVAVHDDAQVFRHELDPRFASFIFASPAFHAQKAQYAGGTKVTRISGGDLAKIAVPIPPRGVQESIGQALASVSANVEALRTELDSLRAFRSTLLSALLSQEIEIPESYDKVLSTLRG